MHTNLFLHSLALLTWIEKGYSLRVQGSLKIVRAYISYALHIHFPIVMLTTFFIVMFIFNSTALVPTDTQEKRYFSYATKPCGQSYCACGRCVDSSYELLDSERIPFNTYRCSIHFTEYCKKNPNVSKAELSKNAGYSTFESFRHNAKSLDNDNIVQKLAIDPNHSTLNQAKYIDKCVKSDYIWVCKHIFMF